MRWTKKRSSTLAHAIDDLFVFCGLSEEDSRSLPAWITKDKVCPSDFSEAEAFLEDGDGGVVEVAKDQNCVRYFADVKPSDVPGFDVSSVKTTVRDDGKRQIELYRIRQEPLRKARGCRIYSPHLASFYSCWVNAEDGKYASRRILVNKAGKQWVAVGAQSEYDHFAKSKTCAADVVTYGMHNNEEITSTCDMLVSLAFTRDIVWRVVFKSPTGISVSLSTDTAGAMAAFRNRQPNEITGRRDALKHWVRQHYRRSPVDEGDEPQKVIVRQHLRGRNPFRWFGMDCELVVSPFDMRRNLRLQRDTKQMALA